MRRYSIWAFVTASAKDTPCLHQRAGAFTVLLISQSYFFMAESNSDSASENQGGSLFSHLPIWPDSSFRAPLSVPWRDSPVHHIPRNEGRTDGVILSAYDCAQP